MKRLIEGQKEGQNGYDSEASIETAVGDKIPRKQYQAAYIKKYRAEKKEQARQWNMFKEGVKPQLLCQACKRAFQRRYHLNEHILLCPKVRLSKMPPDQRASYIAARDRLIEKRRYNASAYRFVTKWPSQIKQDELRKEMAKAVKRQRRGGKPKQSKYDCRFCGKEFATSQKRAQHIYRVHRK